MQWTTNEPISQASPRTLILYGLGFWGFKAFWAFHLTTAVLYLSRHTESMTHVGLVLGLVGYMGCTLPFIVGLLSDRANTPLGRRRPFILFGLSFLTLVFFLMPRVEDFLLCSLLILAADFFMYFAEGPYLSLLADITPAKQRAVGAGTMNMVGVVAWLLYYKFGGDLWDIDIRYPFYLLISFVLVGMAALLLGVKESAPASVRAVAERAGGRKPLDPPPGLPFRLWNWVGSIWQEREACKFFLALFFWWSGYWLVGPWITKFVSSQLGVSQGRAINLMLGYALMPFLFSLPSAWLGDVIGRKRLTSIGLWGWLLGFGSLYFVQSYGQAFLSVLVAGGCYCILLSTTHGFQFSLYPRERVAEFVGLALFCVSVPKILGPSVTGWIIDTFGRESFGNRYMFLLSSLCVFLGWLTLQWVHAVEEKEARVQEKLLREA